MYRKATLNGGITVVTERIPFVRSVSFGAWIRNGSRNEGGAHGGISHFIEHMLFKGTGKRTAKMIADEMDAVGGQLNAYTTKEYTCFFARTLDSHFDVALDIISDMIVDPRFDEAEIEKELNVILEEINMVEDSPEDLLHDLLEERVYAGSDLALPVLGAKESVAAVDRGAFLEYYDKNYHPENAVLAVAGNFDPDDALKKIAEAFAGFKRGSAYKKPELSAVYHPVRAVREKDIEQVHIAFGFPSVGSGTDETYPLLILNTVLGGGMSSRLFQKIREENGLSYSIYSHNSSFTGCGLFSVCAALAANQLERTAELIMEEIGRLFTDRITDDTLRKTKEQIKSNYMLSLESSASRMSSMGRSELMLGRVLTPEELIEKIDAVDLNAIYDIAERVFVGSNMSTAAVGSVSEDDLKKFARPGGFY